MFSPRAPRHWSAESSEKHTRNIVPSPIRPEAGTRSYCTVRLQWAAIYVSFDIFLPKEVSCQQGGSKWRRPIGVLSWTWWTASSEWACSPCPSASNRWVTCGRARAPADVKKLSFPETHPSLNAPPIWWLYTVAGVALKIIHQGKSSSTLCILLQLSATKSVKAHVRRMANVCFNTTLIIGRYLYNAFTCNQYHNVVVYQAGAPLTCIIVS